MVVELLFLLLPIAALSGWLVGRRDARDAGEHGFSVISADYFKGLNFLLNEQPDKAIEVFIRMLEVDSDTVDTHFALGSLFRRRGEVDRAIRIHQNLIARPTLSRYQREQGLFELGVDYMRAGLLDRAENLFVELVNSSAGYRQQALQQLLDIYQQEKDWHKAIATAQRLESIHGEQLEPVVAQYYCELAEQALQAGDYDGARREVRRALEVHANCVRATLIDARNEAKSASHKDVIRVLKRVEQQDAAFLPEVIGMLREAFDRIGPNDEIVSCLRELLAHHGSISVMLALADAIQRQQGEKVAAAFVTEHMRHHPSIRGMARLIDLRLDSSAAYTREDMLVLRALTDQLLDSKPVYRCGHCGFTGRTLHWQCPSCKQWNTTKPIQGIEGE